MAYMFCSDWGICGWLLYLLILTGMKITEQIKSWCFNYTVKNVLFELVGNYVTPNVTKVLPAVIEFTESISWNLVSINITQNQLVERRICQKHWIKCQHLIKSIVQKCSFMKIIKVCWSSLGQFSTGSINLCFVHGDSMGAVHWEMPKAHGVYTTKSQIVLIKEEVHPPLTTTATSDLPYKVLSLKHTEITWN